MLATLGAINSLFKESANEKVSGKVQQKGQSMKEKRDEGKKEDMETSSENLKRDRNDEERETEGGTRQVSEKNKREKKGERCHVLHT